MPNEKERPKKTIKNAFELFGALFETMKEAHDARHIATKHERNIIFYLLRKSCRLNSRCRQKKLALIELGKTNRIIFETVDVLKESPVFLFAFFCLQSLSAESGFFSSPIPASIY